MDFSAPWEGAGALRSTANDLLAFLAANLGYTEASLAPAMAAMLKVRRKTGFLGPEVHLAWLHFTRWGDDIVWHNGGTSGYSSFVGYDPKARVGVVVLSNTQTRPGVTDIGLHLLNSKSYSLLGANALKPPKDRKEVVVDPKVLDGYVGRFRFPSDQGASVIRVTREGGHLVLNGDGYSGASFYAESDRDFFAKLFDAQLSFKTDSQGRATEMIFHLNGSTQRCKRIE
jgi:serine-type D-Ala-D-Ala carboxypeptidase/endopeptidase